MEGYKAILTSKGVWGSIVTIGGVVLGFLGFDVTAADQVEISTLVDRALALLDEVMVIGGSILALYGRITATKKLI